MAFSSRLLLASLVLGAWCRVRAADEAQKPADDSLAANRKDLEAMRADRFLSPEQKLALPEGIDTPGATPMPQAPSPMQLSKKKRMQDELAHKAKSDNWLIEAMDKEKERS